MSILARFEERPERRGAARRILHLGIEPSASMPFATEIIVHDLSLTGALLESTGGTPLPSVFEVQLPDDFVARATVVWSSANLYGCRFARPISPATLSAAQLRSAPPAAQRRPAFPKDLVRQLREVREQVEGLVEQVDRAIESLKRR